MARDRPILIHAPQAVRPLSLKAPKERHQRCHVNQLQTLTQGAGPRPGPSTDTIANGPWLPVSPPHSSPTAAHP